MHTRLPYTASAAITWHKVQCGGCSQCSPSELTNAAFNTFDTIPAADVQTDVLVIGAGMSGIAAAKELHTAGKQFIARGAANESKRVRGALPILAPDCNTKGQVVAPRY